MRKLIQDEGKQKLKISIFGRSLHHYLIFCNERERLWLDFDLTEMSFYKVNKNKQSWEFVKSIPLNHCKRIDEGHLSFAIIEDKEAIELALSLSVD